MPVSYNIDTASKLMRITCASPMTFADVANHFRELKEDPAFAGQLDAFADLSDADLLFETSQLGMITTEVAALRAKAQFRIVAVVATSDVVFGIMRMLEVMVAGYLQAIRIFRSAPEADAWLAARRAEADLTQ